MLFDFKTKEKLGGIYRIRNIINNREYIGSTYFFKRRFAVHLEDLRNNKHHCAFLQNDWNKCNEENIFIFEVLEEVPLPLNGDRELWSTLRTALEQKFLDKAFLITEHCYNSKKKAVNLGYTACSEDRKKINKEKMDEYYSDPEKREECTKRAKEWWENYPANITVKNVFTGEIVFLTMTSREFCKQRNLNYKAFHLLKKGNIKSTGRGENKWILGTEMPCYIDRKGEKRKPMTIEAKRNHSNGKYNGRQIVHSVNKIILTIGHSLREFSQQHEIEYHTLRKLLNGKVKSVNLYTLIDNNYEIQKINSNKNKSLETNTNKILQIDLETGLIIKTWDTAYQASEGVNHSCKSIKKVCNGEKKQAAGFFWCYSNIELQKKYKIYPENYKNAKYMQVFIDKNKNICQN
jgi:group I intron endonuclease